MYKRPPVKDNSRSINFAFSDYADSKDLDLIKKKGSKQEKSSADILQQVNSVRSKEQSKELTNNQNSKELMMSKIEMLSLIHI